MYRGMARVQPKMAHVRSVPWCTTMLASLKVDLVDGTHGAPNARYIQLSNVVIMNVLLLNCFDLRDRLCKRLLSQISGRSDDKRQAALAAARH